MSRLKKQIFFVLLLTVIFLNSLSAYALQLDAQQSRHFREWFLFLVNQQAIRKPNPRWVHRDCAGLIRFAVKESFLIHDTKWKKENGLLNQKLPADVNITQEHRQFLQKWKTLKKDHRSYFVLAYTLIQENTRFVSKSLHQARPGDLLFFDQGQDQHIMIWTGRSFAYHTGSQKDYDKPIKVLLPKELFAWNDSRWRPFPQNPNFLGVYRFSFLSY